MTHPVHRFAPLVAVAALAAAAPAEAIVIDFETASGYSTTGGTGGGGNIVGQPSTPGATPWTGNSTAATVESEAGNQFLQTAASLSASFPGIFYAPTAADLDNDDLSPSVVYFDMRLRSDSVPSSGGNFESVLSIRFDDVVGANQPQAYIRLDVRADGRLRYLVGNGSGGNTSVISKAAGGADFDFDNTTGYVPVSIVADYTTQTFQLTVNGVQQLNGSDANIPFAVPTADNFGRLNLNLGNQPLTNYRQMSLDDLRLSAVVPEPASLGIASLGLFAVLRRGR